LRARGNKKLQSTNCYVHVSSNLGKYNSIAVELKVITKDELDKRDDKWFILNALRSK
jgi:hypothetical protein